MFVSTATGNPEGALPCGACRKRERSRFRKGKGLHLSRLLASGASRQRPWGPFPSMRRPLALALVLLVVAGGASSAQARKLAPAGPGAVFVIAGHGWGHGVGMSQYGAYGHA